MQGGYHVVASRVSRAPAILPAVSAATAHNYQQFGNYILLDRINVGGMAEVFRGKQVGVEGFAKLVALKRILPNISQDPDFIEMFIDEAKLANQMAHANVVQIYDLGQVSEQYYIAMEYVSGVDLRTIWDRARRRNRLLPIAMSCYIMQRVCEGLDYAHRKKDDMGREMGLVHRDVSPQNVLISFEGECKVVDFGIAKAKNKISKTQAGILKGKFGYMSPEQVRGLELDNRSDIFACGAVLYELLVGERLFLGESDFSTLEKVRNVELVPPTQLNKNLSPQVERIVMKALQKNRDERYRYCSEIAEDLQRYLFSSNQPFARTDLQRYMKQHFKAEIDKEFDRIERYRDVSLAAVQPSPAQISISAAPTMAAPLPGAAVADPAEAPTVGPTGPDQLPTALQPRPITVASTLGQPAAPGNGATAPAQPAPAVDLPDVPAVPPQASLPAWAKGLIIGLSGLVVLTLALVVFLVVSRGGPAATSSLTIKVTPSNADIVFEGEVVSSKSPFTINRLEPRSYIVEARKKGYKPVIRPVKVSAGEALMEEITLELDSAHATLFVRSTPPGLDIWLDGKSTGQVTNNTLNQLVAGDHELILKRDGDIVYRSPLVLEPGSGETVDVDITRLPPVLEVGSSQIGARVFIDDRPVGATPLTLDTLRPGSVQIRVEMKDCQPFERTVELKTAVTSKVDASMICKADTIGQASQVGKLNVAATTVADIILDGKNVGRTPVMGLRVPAGMHSIKLVPLSGSSAPHTESVEIVVGETLSINHVF